MTQIVTPSAADPVEELLRLAGQLGDTSRDIDFDRDVARRLDAVLNAVWDLQVTLDGLVARLLEPALSATEVGLVLRRHWAQERQVRAGSLLAGDSGWIAPPTPASTGDQPA
jgi:hypothetical protein